MDQKEYWWCTVLKCWCRHKPEDCRGARRNNQGNQQPRDSKGGRKERMLRAAQALIERSDTNSEDEEEWLLTEMCL